MTNTDSVFTLFSSGAAYLHPSVHVWFFVSLFLWHVHLTCSFDTHLFPSLKKTTHRVHTGSALMARSL